MTTGNRYEFDFIVIGSGFGGSVSALRLAEKGYRVAVLEKGRRYPPLFSAAPRVPVGGFLREILDGGKVVAETPETVAAGASEGAGQRPQVTGLAEREGFEPSVEGLPLHVISSHADSATLASLRL